MYGTCDLEVSSQDRFRLGTYLETSKRIRTTAATAALTSAPSSNLQQHPRMGIGVCFVNYIYALDYSHACLSLRTFSKSCKGFSRSPVISPRYRGELYCYSQSLNPVDKISKMLLVSQLFFAALAVSNGFQIGIKRAHIRSNGVSMNLNNDQNNVPKLARDATMQPLQRGK